MGAPWVPQWGPMGLHGAKVEGANGPSKVWSAGRKNRSTERWKASAYFSDGSGGEWEAFATIFGSKCQSKFGHDYRMHF